MDNYSTYGQIADLNLTLSCSTDFLAALRSIFRSRSAHMLYTVPYNPRTGD